MGSSFIDKILEDDYASGVWFYRGARVGYSDGLEEAIRILESDVYDWKHSVSDDGPGGASRGLDGVVSNALRRMREEKQEGFPGAPEKSPRLWMGVMTLEKDEVLSSNQRLHYRQAAARAAELRAAGAALVADCGWEAYGRPEGQVGILARIQYPTRHRADPCNMHPTVKPVVDGIVDSGFLEDDDHRHVVGPDYRRIEGATGTGVYRVDVIVYETGRGVE